MMGAHHAACGAAAWVAVTSQVHVDLTMLAEKAPFLPHSLDLGLGLLHTSPLGVVTGAIVTAGAAMLPDADHHNATIAHSLPPLSNAMCAGIGKVSGGHRHGTHSIIGIAVFTAVAWVLGFITPLGIQQAINTVSGHPHAPTDSYWYSHLAVGAGILSILLTAFAAKALKIIPDSMRKSPWVVGITLGVLIMLFAPQEQNWFPIAMGVGALVHILGDMLTIEGCNLAWPFTIKPPKAIASLPIIKQCWHQNGYMTVPILGHAGSVREWFFLIPISAYAIFGVGTVLVTMGQDGLQHMIALAGLR